MSRRLTLSRQRLIVQTRRSAATPRSNAGRRRCDALVAATAALTGRSRLRAADDQGHRRARRHVDRLLLSVLREQGRRRERTGAALSRPGPRRIWPTRSATHADGGISSAWVSHDDPRTRADLSEHAGISRRVVAAGIATGPLGEQAHALRQEVFDALDQALGDAFPNVAIEARQRCLGIALDTAYRCCRTSTTSGSCSRNCNGMLGLYLASYFSRSRPRCTPRQRLRAISRSGR